MNTAMLTDHQLVTAFNSKKTEQSITFIACFTNSDHDILEAANKTEARRIASEYAVRILGTKLETIYAMEEN